MKRLTAMMALTATTLLAACANTPPSPDWQLNAKGSLDRSVQAYLQGNSRIAAVEFASARRELARTGRADLLARAELTRCAAQVASLVFEVCAAYAPLAADAGEAQRAYNDYLKGALKPADVDLLPEQHRALALGKPSLETLQAMRDPLAQLVAAAVLLQTGRAEPAVMDMAVNTSSAQGWSRPLLAWLNAQLMRAQAAGEVVRADQLRRRIERVLEPASAR